MPQETTKLMFKPTSFFSQNPALDVPQVADLRSKSAFMDHRVGTVNTTRNGTNEHGANRNGVNGHDVNGNGTNGNGCCN